MKRTLPLLLLAASLLAGYSQQTPPTNAGVTSLWDTVNGIFDLHNTNSLVNAQELNITPLIKYDSERQRFGGALKIDWWVTDQQGASIGYTEYGNRESFWNIGYQARTVFKGLEVALGTGINQSTDATLGDVRMYLQPSFTYKLSFIKFADTRLTAGCDIVATQRPSPFLGLTLRFGR